MFTSTFNIVYNTENVGTATNIPIIPNRLAPTLTATSTHIPGNPIDVPTTLGYIKFPSTCCNIIINIINVITFIIFTDAINTAPIAAPINAPTIGINAVTPINTPICTAYGICNINIPIIHNVPKITASKHCIVKKFANVFLVSLAIPSIFLSFSFFTYSNNIFVICFCYLSLLINIYIANIIAITVVDIALTKLPTNEIDDVINPVAIFIIS